MANGPTVFPGHQNETNNMPTFNAEAVIKATEKRIDKLESSVASLEKAVKVLIDTRGDSKEDAVRKLQLVVTEQGKMLEKVPLERIRLIEAGLKQQEARLIHLTQEGDHDQRMVVREAYEKSRSELQAATAKIVEDLAKTRSEYEARAKSLKQQVQDFEKKREEASARQFSAVIDQQAQFAKSQSEAIRAQVDAKKDQALLESRMVRLEAMVDMLLKMPRG